MSQTHSIGSTGQRLEGGDEGERRSSQVSICPKHAQVSDWQLDPENTAIKVFGDGGWGLLGWMMYSRKVGEGDSGRNLKRIWTLEGMSPF